MIKKITIIIIFFLTTLCVSAFNYRVVGYILPDNDFDKQFEKIHWDVLTHLNVAFVLVGPNGELNTSSVEQYLQKITEVAHRNNVKVLVSFQSEKDGFYKTIQNPEKRKRLTLNILDFVKKYNLDGFDLDYELYDHICPELILFAKEIHNRKDGKILQTCAVPCFNPITEGGYTTKWHKYFDFINLMAYDATGPWAEEGPHAPFQQMINGVQLWTKDLEVPYEKLVVGLPFYGWSWDKANVRSLTYNQILSIHADSITPNIDVIGRTYYNGEMTIRKKTQYVVDKKLGGVMIWHLFSDAENEGKKLLNVIEDVIFQNKIKNSQN